MPERLVVSPAEAAEITGLCRQTIYNLIADGRLRRVKIGRSARIPMSDILALIEGDR